ncbi:hypothetical protein BGX26_006432, partial [Mortierella sp. AD094]
NPKQSTIYSDATLTQGAWVSDRGTSKNFPVPKNFRHSSFASEAYAANRAIRDNETKNTRLNLRCDHQGLCSVLNNHVVRHPQKYPQVDTLLTGLFSRLDSKKISLSATWIPSESNLADKPSRSVLKQQ